jgi:large subunit ribosomal protein L21
MRALVEISDKQFLVQTGDKLYVPTQQAETGATLTYDKVLLTTDGTTAIVSPKTRVTAKVLEHGKGEKVMIFKKKRRKRYRRTKGHRQGYTQIEIVSIG